MHSAEANNRIIFKASFFLVWLVHFLKTPSTKKKKKKKKNETQVIVVGNGHGDTSSNPGRDLLNFT